MTYIPYPLPSIMAFSTVAPTFFSYVSVLFSILVTVFTMGDSVRAFFISRYGFCNVLRRRFYNYAFSDHIRVTESERGALDNSVRLDSVYSGKFYSEKGLTPYIDVSVPTDVSTLLLSGRPFAVARRVSEIVVDTVKGVKFSRFNPHIGKEVNVAFNPTLAHYYAPASVVGILSVIRVGASLLHTLPRSIVQRGFCVRHFSSGKIINGVSILTCLVLGAQS